MPVPSSISDLSQTASSNSPAGSESPVTADDYVRALSSFIAILRDGRGYSAEVQLASAATCSIGAANSPFIQITGTTTITSFGTPYNGPRFLRFASALTLTHNASTLILPGGANITTAAGDRAIVTPIGSPGSGWQVIAYIIASAVPGQVASETVSGIVELATTTEASTGTDTQRAVTAAGVEAHMNANEIGWGQTWQNVTASRTMGIGYSNATGRPIQVIVDALNSTNSSYGVLTPVVGGVSLPIARSVNNASGALVSFIVPTGLTYSVTNTGTAMSLTSWLELR